VSILSDLLILSLFQTPNFNPPRLERGAPLAHSLNIIRSSWVIMDLEIDPEGKVAVRSSKGVNPFRDMALTSVRQWTFAPARTKEPVESRVTAVFLFRPRDLFAGAAPQIPKSSGSDPDRPPLPLKVSDPGYPRASIGEGAVMLELRIAQTGSLENVRVVTGVGGLTEPTEKVARTWGFEPALRKGAAVPGTVIAVVSYLRPVLYAPSPKGN